MRKVIPIGHGGNGDHPMGERPGFVLILFFGYSAPSQIRGPIRS
jgi:hypothetical protein